MGKNSSRSIGYQFECVINNSFKDGGVDKHSEKRNGNLESTPKVFSYAERKALKSLSYDLGRFIKSEYGIRLVKDIKPEIVQCFLEKKKESCSRATLGTMRSQLHKMGKLVNRTYKTADVKWDHGLKIPDVPNIKIRDVTMSREHYNRILDRSAEMKSRSLAPIAIELAGRFGMRVAETTKLQPRDIDIENMTLHIHESKGRRSRDISIREEDVPFLRRISEGKQMNKNIVTIKEGSVNKYLERAQISLGIREEYKKSKTSIHSIRKMRAQEIYREALRYMTKKEALAVVNGFLGHGARRFDTTKVYLDMSNPT